MATKTQLVEAILDYAGEDSGLTKKDANTFLTALADAISEVIENADAVTIPGVVRVGVRVKKATKARMGRNPRTGEDVKIAAKPASVVVTARVPKALKEFAPTVQKVNSRKKK